MSRTGWDLLIFFLFVSFLGCFYAYVNIPSLCSLVFVELMLMLLNDIFSSLFLFSSLK